MNCTCGHPEQSHVFVNIHADGRVVDRIKRCTHCLCMNFQEDLVTENEIDVKRENLRNLLGDNTR